MDYEYQHKHYREMHRECYEKGTPCVPTTYGDAIERWEMLGTGDTSIIAGWAHDNEPEYCARCDERILTGTEIVTYCYWWNS